MALSLPGLSQAQQVILPAFQFSDLEGHTFAASQLDPSRPVFVMMFDPYCDHCQTQAENIAAAADAFEAKEVQFVWVTLDPEPEAIAKFRDHHFGETGLREQMHFLMDTEIRFEEYFGYTDDAVNIYCYKPGAKRPRYFGEEQEATVLLKYL